jgi:hypothetical protein
MNSIVVKEQSCVRGDIIGSKFLRCGCDLCMSIGGLNVNASEFILGGIRFRKL